jgi:hypothetical protein
MSPHVQTRTNRADHVESTLRNCSTNRSKRSPLSRSLVAA